jgi:bifunctional DNase/RNase
MLRVEIESVRVSLMSQHRLVVLKETDGERYLPIWIGPFEADAIAIELQGISVARPLTHDLLRNILYTLDVQVNYVVVTELADDTFYANIILGVDGDEVPVDSRPSDAIALAVRTGAPIFVEEEVMDAAGIVPDRDITEGVEEENVDEMLAEVEGHEGEDELGAFREFLSKLDFGDMPGEEEK